MKNCTLLALLLLFALGAKANPDTPPRADRDPAFEVFADYYPEAGYEHSPYVKVYWGVSLYDFEMGSLPDDWTNDNEYPWVVTSPSIEGYHGEYCLMSGNSGVGSSTSTIETTVTFVEDGSVSFLGGCYGEGTDSYNVWDACEFYIDDEKMFSHGSLQSWDVYSYDVTVGTHTFKWSYSKDYYENSPGDAFFVDDVIFSGTTSMGTPGAGYDVYRQSYDDATDTFGAILQIAANVTEKQYIDGEWEILTPGQYRFGALDPNVAGADIVWSDLLVKSTVDYFEITVGVNDSSRGTVRGGGTFTYGETCTLVATPNLGSTFQGWYDGDGNLVDYENTYTFTVKESATYTAQFDLMAIYPWFISQPEEGGTAEFADGDGDGAVYYGESMTFTATPNQGYAFLEWGIPVGDSYEVIATEPEFTMVFDSVFLSTYGDNEYGIEEMGFFAIFAQADGDCIQPQNFVADEVGPTSATLSWKEYGASESWSIYYRPTQTDVSYDSTEVFQNPCTLSLFQPNTTYEAFVVPSCGVDQYGANEWVSSYTTEFTTLDACPVPQKVTVDNITASTATVTWKDYSESYRVSMGLADVMMDETFENGIPEGWGCDTTRYAWTLVDGHLQSSNAGVPYSSSSIAYTATYLGDGIVAFDALCHGEGEDWAFDVCAFYIDDQQVLFIGSGDTGWHRYSFDVPSGTHTFLWDYNKDSDFNSPDDCFAIDNVLMAATSPSNEAPIAVEDAEYTITGLTPNTVYFVQVQALCDQQQTEWCSPVFFTTLEGQQYTITATANPTVGGTIEGAGSYVEDDDCTLTATANEGYTFTNWTEDGAVVDTNPVFTFTVDGDRTLVANFTLKSYFINVLADPTVGGTVEGADTYNHGDICTLTATPNQGYQFVGWFCNNDIVTEEATYSFEVGGPATFVAVFQLIQYYPLLSSQPEAYGYAWVDSDNAQIIQYGEEVTLKAMPEYGYHLVNWMTLDADGNPTIELSTDTVFTFTMDANNILTSLYPDGGTVEFIAFFELNTYEITASANPTEGGTISGEDLVDGVGTFPHGSECTLTANVATGYNFVSWTENGSVVSEDAEYTFTVTGERNLIANFELKTYNITATAQPEIGGGITVEGDAFTSGTYEHGFELTLVANPSDDYIFVSWTENGSVVSEDAEYTFTVTGERNLIATFELNTFQITVETSSDEAGTVDGAGTYTLNDQCTLTAIPNEGFSFLYWTKDGDIVSTSPTYQFVVTEEATYIAVFIINSYDITVEAEPEEGGVVTGAGTFNHFDNCEITATANENYNFVNWTKDGVEVSTEATYTFMVTEEATYVAHFEMKTYDITATANPEEGGTVTGAGTYNVGASCTLKATAASGYSFYKWTKDGVRVSSRATYTFTVTEDGDYVAHFRQNYSITATANPEVGGTITGTGVYSQGSTATLNATAAEGYTFVNWTEEGEIVSSDATYSFEVTGERTLVANFELNSYEVAVTANPAVGGTVEGGGTFNHGESCTVTATAAEGYTFMNWTEDGEEVSWEPEYTFTVEGARTLVANFSLDEYVITAEADPAEGGTVSGEGFVDGEGDFAYGSTCTVTATANEGYTFINWTKYGEEVSTDATYSFTVEAPASLVAHFTLNSYEVTATANPAVGGTVEGGGTFNHGESCTLTATAAEGYTFVNWTEDGVEVSTTPEYTFEVTGERILVANFTLNSYTILVEAHPEEGGLVNGGDTYNHGESCTVTATPHVGYHFVNWTENEVEVSTSAEYTFTVTGERLLFANFELNSYEITTTVNPANSGTVEGAGTFNHFEECTVTATAAEGYTFLNWTEDGAVVSTTPEYSFEVTGERTLVANFELNSYEVAVTADPAVGGTVEGGGTFNHGESCTVTATAAEGYTFEGWTEDGEEVSWEPEYTFEVTGARTLVAHFTLDIYAVMLEADPVEGGTVEGEGFDFGEGDFAYGSTCTVTATANEGYTFVNWTNFGEEVSTVATYSFTVEAPASLVAHFTLNSYEVTATANPAVGGTVEGGGTFNHGESCTVTATAAEGYTFVNWTEDGVEVSTTPEYTFEVTGERILVANFTLNSYTILVEAHPEEGGLVNGGDTYNHGESCTVTATPHVGYHFVNWTENEVEVSTSAEYTFTVTGERLLFANFELNSYEITTTVNPANSGTVEGAGTFNHFEECTVTATAAEGYTFEGWSEDGELVSTDAAYTFEVTGARNLVANFIMNSYEVAVMANPAVGGTVEGGGTFNHGSTCTVTATAAEGYTFVNWTEDGEEVSWEPEYTFTVEGARTLVANFSLDIYAVMLEADPVEGGTVEGEGFEFGEGDFAYGSTCTVTATANEGYTFVNWTNFGEEVATTTTYTFTVEAPASLVAHFTLNSYEVTATANPAVGGTVEGAGTFNHGESCTLTATAAEGYTFVNWTENGAVVSNTPEYTFEVTGARTLVANFTLDIYAITLEANPAEGGTVSGQGFVNGEGDFAYGSTCTVTATANEGYTFVNWTKFGAVVATTATYTFTVESPAILVANFSLNSYEVTATANPSNGGTVEGGGTYNYGASCTVTATAATGYTFAGWTENGNEVSNNATYTFTVTGERNLVANFDLISHVITATADPVEGGTVEGAGTYNHFFRCTLTATPSIGYTFVNWTKDGEMVSTDAVYSFYVMEDAEYVANFTQSKYLVTATTDPDDTGDIQGAGFYLYGETCTLTVIPHENYKFMNWTLNGQVVSDEASISFTVTEDVFYVAHLESTEGVEEHNNIAVSVFPNPAKDKLTIETSEPVKMLEIYTINGSLVGKQRTYSDKIEINVEGFAIGTYMIRLTTDSTVLIRKFVKE